MGRRVQKLGQPGSEDPAEMVRRGDGGNLNWKFDRDGELRVAWCWLLDGAGSWAFVGARDGAALPFPLAAG